jgi:cytochrome c peroxidase
MNRLSISFAVVVSGALAGVAFAQEGSLRDKAKGIFKPVPAQFVSAQNPITPEKVALGKMLFFEKRLSKNQDVSCNSCHDLAKFGVDGTPVSVGHKKQKGGRNAPTVYNAGNHIAQFWDGRAPTVEEQAKGPVTNPIEMALPDAATAEKVLKSIPGYAPLFAKAFPGEADSVTFENFAKAVGAFERTLSTPSRFDAFLNGDEKALNASELQGLTKFMELGCISCHQGEGVGGSMYQRLGYALPVAQLKDQGRFEATKKEADRFFFRVPSLRNVAKTAPYLHDGSIATLPEMVKYMAKYQLNRELSDDDVKSLVTFLNSLTGTLPKAAIAKPNLPPSGKETPKADPT